MVVFDEFQGVLSAQANADEVIRSEIQHHDDAASYIFAGSEVGMMDTLFGIAGAPCTPKPARLICRPCLRRRPPNSSPSASPRATAAWETPSAPCSTWAPAGPSLRPIGVGRRIEGFGGASWPPGARRSGRDRQRRHPDVRLPVGRSAPGRLGARRAPGRSLVRLSRFELRGRPAPHRR